MVEISTEIYNSLTAREKLYLKIIRPQHGVLFLKSAPGRAKSAILATLAKKLGWQYIDLRLAQLDPIAVGMFPSTDVVTINNKSFKVMDFVTPKWALKANEKPTLINFDELNRAPEDVLKAAMQIFNERAIGTEFKFNDNVFMAATGNLGADDATDVNELDSALNGRLIHINHDLKYTEWLDWGKDIIHPAILQYITHKKAEGLFESFNRDKNQSSRVLNKEAYASPRTWHFLSEFIQVNYGKNADIRDWLKEVSKIAKSYIGDTIALDFITFCTQLSEISLTDVLAMSQRTENRLAQMQKLKTLYVFSGVCSQLERLSKEDIEVLNATETANINKFLHYCNNEQVAALLQHFTLDSQFIPLSSMPIVVQKIQEMFKGFNDILQALKKYESM